MSVDLHQVATVAKAAVARAASLVVEIRGSGDLGVRSKAQSDFVTRADLASEDAIISEIKRHFPDHGVLAEESSPTLKDRSILNGPLWIIDPVDGTTNFSRGHAHVGVSVAFALGGVVQVGVVGAPFLGETYWAIRGGGAFCNGQKIGVSQISELEPSLIATGYPYRTGRQPSKLMARDGAILNACSDLRRLGAASIDCCWVAAGRFEAYVENVKPWDIAAAALIVREAGGQTTCGSGPSVYPSDINGDGFIASNGIIHGKLRELLASHHGS